MQIALVGSRPRVICSLLSGNTSPLAGPTMAINLASGARWTMDVSGNFQSADRAGDSVTDSSSRWMLMSHELGVIAARTISVVRSALAPPKPRFQLNRSCPYPRRFLRPDVLTPCLSPDRQTESGRLEGNDRLL